MFHQILMEMFGCKPNAACANKRLNVQSKGMHNLHLQKATGMIKIELDRISGDFGFEARDAEGHTVLIDGNPALGEGTGQGVRPMQLLLMGLGGCSGIDIISILKKQRQIVEKFSISIEAEREQGKEPALWSEAKLLFTVTGNIDADKFEKACSLSMEKYCSVAETLRLGGTNISWESKVVASSTQK